MIKAFFQSNGRSPAEELQDGPNQVCIPRLLMKDEENVDDTVVFTQELPIVTPD